MSDLQIKVRSNVSALSERVLHDAFVDLVRHAIREMRDVARAEAPKREGLLEEHITDEEIAHVAGLIEGRVGVTAVEEADERKSSGRYRRSSYPAFVESGTKSPIFPATPGGLLWNMPEGIFGRIHVRGQEAQPFMAEAYAQARAILDADPSVERALKEMAARAAAELPAVER